MTSEGFPLEGIASLKVECDMLTFCIYQYKIYTHILVRRFKYNLSVARYAKHTTLHHPLHLLLAFVSQQKNIVTKELFIPGSG